MIITEVSCICREGAVEGGALDKTVVESSTPDNGRGTGGGDGGFLGTEILLFGRGGGGGGGGGGGSGDGDLESEERVLPSVSWAGRLWTSRWNASEFVVPGSGHS